MNSSPTPLPKLRSLMIAAFALNACRCNGARDSTPRPRPANIPVVAPSGSNTDAGTGEAPVDVTRIVTLDDVPIPDVGAVSADADTAGSPTGTTLDLPTAQSWPAVNRWNDQMEREFSDFVRHIGVAVEERRCGRLDRCLRDPAINTLYDPATEGRLRLDVDCGDLPYTLRAYFAFKRRLPFGYVDAVTGSGTDPRYMLRVRPVLFRKWNDYRSPRSILRHIGEAVHSGMYRTEPDQEQSDFYPVAVTRAAIRPGTTYYDPNGHVLVVADVRDDGTIFLIDGHPDGSLTFKRFGEAFELGPRRLWGGFKNWRWQVWDGTQLTRVANTELSDFDPNMQWNRDLWVEGVPRDEWLPPSPDQSPGSVAWGMYHRWVRRVMAAPNVVRDPVRDFRELAQSLCRDITDRNDAVVTALATNIHTRSHPGSLPYNIYGTNGDWEMYSTPSRDARLKASVREIHQSLSTLPAGSPLRAQMLAAWNEERARPECRFTYTNSVQASVPFTIDTVLDRLFTLSFDPYHCPELRWGAPTGSQELSTCPDNAEKLGWYRAEQRLRNQIDRHYGVPTPITMGPTETPVVDFRAVLGAPVGTASATPATPTMPRRGAP